MRIANPIYDTVFKYLLEDNQLAKLILSTILNEEITELELSPQERTTTIGARHLTVYRLDFSATIKNVHGEYRKILIEIQKAKLDTDIMRFRRYLGEQYRDPNNVKWMPISKIQEDSNHALKKQALPLVTIYFLGHTLEYTQAPVIHVRRDCYDLATKEKLEKKEPFIEGLSHDSYVIQIPHLHHKRRTKVEQLLQVFDQARRTRDKHILEIDEEEIPEHYRPILRRLQRAIAETQVIEAMDIEDDVLEELQELEREVERERAEKKQAQSGMERERVEKERERVEKEWERAEKERERAEKEQEQREKKRLLAILKQAGIEP
ncbi:conserved hypothetical protein [Gammaproteobacteria bacterium]